MEYATRGNKITKHCVIRGKKNAFFCTFTRFIKKSRPTHICGWRPFLIYPSSFNIAFLVINISPMSSYTHIRANYPHFTYSFRWCTLCLSSVSLWCIPYQRNFRKTEFCVVDGLKMTKLSDGTAQRIDLPCSSEASSSKKNFSSFFFIFFLPLLFLYLRQRSHLGSMAAHLK